MLHMLCCRSAEEATIYFCLFYFLPLYNFNVELYHVIIFTRKGLNSALLFVVFIELTMGFLKKG